MKKKINHVKCPFCGNEKAMMVLPSNDNGAGYFVICNAETDGCGASTGWASTVELAWKLWDTRS